MKQQSKPRRRSIRLLALALLLPIAATAAGPQDHFHYLAEINKASLVMLAEERLVSAGLAADIAQGIAQIIEEQDREGAARSSNYLHFERRLLEIAGPEASRLHTGRSRQDIGSTMRRMAMRDALLDTYNALLAARYALLDLAAANVETIIPAYTHGVQAQPTTLAHYLLAFSAAFERDAQRLEEVYARLNLSPLGAAALGTSGFPLNRERLAELLGFNGIVENSYDANLVSSVDSKIEFANALATSAITVGQLMQNLHTQYHNPRPWILLEEGQTDVSSIMPQKRNPRPLDKARLLATEVIGSAQTVALKAHNTNSGMNDYRPDTQVLHTMWKARAMYTAYVAVMTHLFVDRQRALEEVEADYSTMTEVADVLLREAEVPFRIGYHYASALTSYGRSAGKRPKELTDYELASLYLESTDQELPVDVAVIRRAMDPAAMVGGRRGAGGPQADEVRRMLARHNQSLEAQFEWLEAVQKRRDDSAVKLQRNFFKIQ